MAKCESHYTYFEAQSNFCFSDMIWLASKAVNSRNETCIDDQYFTVCVPNKHIMEIDECI